MATKLTFLNLFLIFLHFCTCLGSLHRKSSFASSGDPVKNAIANQLKKSLEKQLQKNSETTQSGEVPQSTGIYEISFAVGTPPQNLTSIMDISTGFTWTQCKTCDACLNQTTPLYNPVLSTTYSNFSTRRCDSIKSNDRAFCDYFGITSSIDCPDPDCEYIMDYDDDQNSTGLLATDNFMLGSNSAPNIFFGCGLENYGDYDNSSGILGLGWGPLSIVSQFPFMRFSYCLSSDQRKPSPVNFGSLAKLQGTGQSTPLLGTDEYPDLYYIGLVNITVGTTLLNIPSSTFELAKDGEGGVFLATIIAFTYLERAAYDVVAQAFSSMINQTTVNATDLVDLHLCYKNVTKWPSLTLHFDGGATLKLKTVNYVYKVPDTDIQCLAIHYSKGVSALGTLIQMDTNFVYDLKNKTISFEKCFDDSTSTSSVISNIPHLVTTMALFLFYVCSSSFDM
ncbi:hypothetical protein LUZ60_001373 [Juncus effusus]|nr:hypothetical protein LUZ60_001373 [Juncus effusus]